MSDKIQEIKNKIGVEEKPEFKVNTSQDVINTDYGEYKFIVDKLIPRDGITFISSQPKAGKSWFLLHLIDELSKEDGLFFKEFKTQKTKILLIDEENSLRGIQRRLSKLNKEVDFNLMSQQSFRLLNSNHRDWLIQYIKDNEIELIIFDSFRRIHEKEENDSGEMALIYENFKELMNKAKVAILCTHHNRKLQRFEKLSMDAIRGSGDIPAMAESLILMQTDRLKGDNAGNETLMLPILREDASLGTFKVKWFDNLDGGIEFEYKEYDETANKEAIARDNIIDLFKKNDGWYLNKKEIYSNLKGCGAGKSNLGDAIDKLLDERIINKKQLEYDEYFKLKNEKKVTGDYGVKIGKKTKAHFYYLDMENTSNNEVNYEDMGDEEIEELFK